MRTIIIKEATIPVKTVLELEYDPLTRQSSIVSASIADNTIITPRKVYSSMKPGDYAGMDAQAQESILSHFLLQVAQYRKTNNGSLPDDEIRSAPIPLQQWEKLMTQAIGVANRFPIKSVVEYFVKFALFAEPVVCKVPTVYLWEIDPGSGEIDKSMIHAYNQLGEPGIEKTNEGSLRIFWKKFAQ